MNDPLVGAAAHPRVAAGARPRPGRALRDVHGAGAATEHDHLVDLEQRSLLCTCRGCYLLFTPDGAGGGRFRAVPDRYLAFPDFRAVARASGTRSRSR